MRQIAPTESLGPAMQGLTDMQRKFVIAMLETGGRDHTQCARAAGYSGNDNTMRVQAHTLAHNPRVLLALKEEADRRLKAGAVLGASVLLEIADNPTHKDRFKAASRLLDQAGLGVIHEVNHTHTHKPDEDVVARIERLCKMLNVDPVKLLGHAAPAATAPAAEPIDAEFSEITDAEFEELEERERIDDEDAMTDGGRNGLEDIL